MNSEVYIRIGELLRLEREQRRIEISSAASELKISETHLRHIEDGNAAGLPADLYFHLFAKSYAAFLGIDYTRTLEAIRADLGDTKDVSVLGEMPEPEPAELVTVTKAKGREERNSWVLLLGLLIAIALAWGAYQYVDNQKHQALAEEYENAATNSGSAQAKETSFIEPRDPNALLSLSVLARVGSYALILADGDTAVRGELVIGKDYQIEAKHNLTVSIGAPEAVDVRLNGRRARFVDPFSGRVGRVEINWANYKQFLLPSDASDSLSLKEETVPQ